MRATLHPRACARESQGGQELTCITTQPAPGTYTGGMRTFDDERGQRWQVALLDASYGSIMLVFSPLRGGELRRCMLQVETMAAGMAEFAALDDAGLCLLLSQADPWDPAAG